MMHYHGTPLTPKHELMKLAGKNFCVSFNRPNDIVWCLSHGQSVMLDNGAFSMFTKNKQPKWDKFYTWLEDKISPVNWAVVPDVIGGDVDDNFKLAKEWPHEKNFACAVWHMDEPLEQIDRLLSLGFGKIAFGSSGRFWEIGSPVWEQRANEAFNYISKRGPIPWVHMMRGLSLSGDIWPFASADSTNVARNFKDTGVCPERMARRIDAVQCPVKWRIKEIQTDFFNEVKNENDVKRA